MRLLNVHRVHTGKPIQGQQSIGTQWPSEGSALYGERSPEGLVLAHRPKNRYLSCYTL